MSAVKEKIVLILCVSDLANLCLQFYSPVVLNISCNTFERGLPITKSEHFSFFLSSPELSNKIFRVF